MKTTPVRNYDTIHYTHPSCKGGMPSKRWIVVTIQPDVLEHDEVAVLNSHPERIIDAVFPLHIKDVTDLAIALIPHLCGEDWALATISDPAEDRGEFDYDAF